MAKDAERVAQEVGTRELFAVVRGKSRAVEPTEALRELLARQPSRTALLTEIVTDPGRPPELRASGAVALGHDRKPSHQRALVEVLSSREPLLVRRAAGALGRIGDERALAALERLEAPPGPAQRSVAFARSLIAYRLGLDTHRLTPPPPETVPKVRPERSVELPTRAPTRAVLSTLAADAARELPAIAVTAAGAQQITCDGSVFAIVLADTLGRGRSVAALTRSTAVLGAVLEQSQVSGHFSLYEYLLSEPAGGSSVRILGARETGAIVHVGELRADESGAFTVRAVDTPVSPPVVIEGTFDAERGRLAVTRALAASQRAARGTRPGTPTRVEFPGG
jgi:hypothetical protein